VGRELLLSSERFWWQGLMVDGWEVMTLSRNLYIDVKNNKSSASALGCSPSAQVRAAAAQAQRTRWNQRKEIVIMFSGIVLNQNEGHLSGNSYSVLQFFWGHAIYWTL